MRIKSNNSLGSLQKLTIENKEYNYFDLSEAASKLGFDIKRLPYSLRILFFNVDQCKFWLVLVVFSGFKIILGWFLSLLLAVIITTFSP
mgnify:CR=1 FL=1